jgi:DNA repair exonuclease SbcCD ATPase subunit
MEDLNLHGDNPSDEEIKRAEEEARNLRQEQEKADALNNEESALPPKDEATLREFVNDTQTEPVPVMPRREIDRKEKILDRDLKDGKRPPEIGDPSPIKTYLHNINNPNQAISKEATIEAMRKEIARLQDEINVLETQPVPTEEVNYERP